MKTIKKPHTFIKTNSVTEFLLKPIKFPGAQAGTMIALPVSGVLADEINWESVFYVFGALGILWFIFWAYLCHNSPASHPRIDQVIIFLFVFYNFKIQIDQLPISILTINWVKNNKFFKQYNRILGGICMFNFAQKSD